MQEKAPCFAGLSWHFPLWDLLVFPFLGTMPFLLPSFVPTSLSEYSTCTSWRLNLPLFPPLEFLHSAFCLLFCLFRFSRILSTSFLLDFPILLRLSLPTLPLTGKFLTGHLDWCLRAGLAWWSHDCLWFPVSSVCSAHFTYMHTCVLAMLWKFNNINPMLQM